MRWRSIPVLIVIHMGEPLSHGAFFFKRESLWYCTICLGVSLIFDVCGCCLYTCNISVRGCCLYGCVHVTYIHRSIKHKLHTLYTVIHTYLVYSRELKYKVFVYRGAIPVIHMGKQCASLPSTALRVSCSVLYLGGRYALAADTCRDCPPFSTVADQKFINLNRSWKYIYTTDS